MTTNSIVEILNLQNQIQDLETRLAPLIEQDPYNPSIIDLRLDLARMTGALGAHLEIAEIISRN
jgi:hypothetical protein